MPLLLPQQCHLRPRRTASAHCLKLICSCLPLRLFRRLRRDPCRRHASPRRLAALQGLQLRSRFLLLRRLRLRHLLGNLRFNLLPRLRLHLCAHARLLLGTALVAWLGEGGGDGRRCCRRHHLRLRHCRCRSRLRLRLHHRRSHHRRRHRRRRRLNMRLCRLLSGVSVQLGGRLRLRLRLRLR